MRNKSTQAILQTIYQRLYRHFGPQHWWPGRTKTEIIIGAILTQNTNWGNVEKALTNLRKARQLTFPALKNISTQRLASLIRPSGYFNIKAKRVKNFVRFLYDEYDGKLTQMAQDALPDIRSKILTVNGIGPETADSILLYAFGKSVFVVDAYTKRFLHRHNVVGRQDTYHQIQDMFMDHIPKNEKKYNEYHALIVMLGKNYCKPTPACDVCPLNDVNYSLTNKCSSCHVHLKRPGDRWKRKERSSLQQYVCRSCQR